MDGLPVDIKSIHDKQTFNQRTKRFSDNNEYLSLPLS